MRGRGARYEAMRSTRQLNSDHPIGTLLVGADDPRVRRAMHLLFEKQVLVDVVKDVAPLMMGGFIYPFSEFATPRDQLAKRLG